MKDGAKVSVLIFVVLTVLLSGANAQTTQFGGHIKYQISQLDYESSSIFDVLGAERPQAHEFDGRLKTTVTSGQSEFDLHGEVLGIGGGNLDVRREVLNRSGLQENFLPTDDLRLFDLSQEILDESDAVAVARLDRLSYGWTSQSLALKIGRQAISWGNGLTFQVLDLFNPFSPTDIDKDYKTGDDMLFAQLLFDNGDNLELLAIPRRDENHDVESAQSSFASKYRGRGFGFDYDLLIAEHYEETVAGAGLSRDVLEAVWRTDLSITELKDGGSAWALVTNIDRSFEVCGKNLYTFIEYFRSGVGESSSHYDMLSEELTERLIRGELYTLASNYISGGLRLEMGPLLNWYINEIVNLDDSGGVFQTRWVFDATSDFILTAGVNLPYGGRGSESGGIPLGPDIFLTPGNEIYLRAAYHF